MSFAASSFRSCTSAISSRTFARSSIPRSSSRLARLGTRHYSEATTSSPESKREQPKEANPECTELEAKLKAKEAEVADLTVSLFSTRHNAIHIDP